MSLRSVCRQVFALHSCFAGKVLLLQLPLCLLPITELTCASHNNITCHLLCFLNSFHLQQKKSCWRIGLAEKAARMISVLQTKINGLFYNWIWIQTINLDSETLGVYISCLLGVHLCRSIWRVLILLRLCFCIMTNVFNKLQGEAQNTSKLAGNKSCCVIWGKFFPRYKQLYLRRTSVLYVLKILLSLFYGLITFISRYS